jgi:hypothetical protein
MWVGGAGLRRAVARRATMVLPDPWDRHRSHDPPSAAPAPRKAIAQRLQDRRSRADPYLGIPPKGSLSLLRREGRPVSDRELTRFSASRPICLASGFVTATRPACERASSRMVASTSSGWACRASSSRVRRPRPSSPICRRVTASSGHGSTRAWRLSARHPLQRVARSPSRTSGGGTPGGCRRLQGALAARLARAVPADDLVRAAIARLCGQPSTRVSELGHALGISERHLRRRFRAAVGYGPKTLDRVLRFQRALGLLRDQPLAPGSRRSPARPAMPTRPT